MTSKSFALVRGLRGTLAQSLPPGLYGAARRIWRRTRLVIPSSWQSSTHSGIPGPVHDEDYMLRDVTDAAILHYIRTGAEPLDRIGRCLADLGRGWSDVHAALDFGSGYGRVLRFLRDRHPHVAVTAADVNEQAVRFCAKVLGAKPWVVSPDVAALGRRGTFDLVWVGSVLTHLKLGDDAVLLDRLAAHLAPGGLLVFTTLSDFIPGRLAEYGDAARGRADDIRAALSNGTASHVEATPGAHPITFHARGSVHRLIAGIRPAVRLVQHAPRGWDDHQDVWGCARVE